MHSHCILSFREKKKSSVNARSSVYLPGKKHRAMTWDKLIRAEKLQDVGTSMFFQSQWVHVSRWTHSWEETRVGFLGPHCGTFTVCTLFLYDHNWTEGIYVTTKRWRMKRMWRAQKRHGRFRASGGRANSLTLELEEKDKSIQFHFVNRK